MINKKFYKTLIPFCCIILFIIFIYLIINHWEYYFFIFNKDRGRYESLIEIRSYKKYKKLVRLINDNPNNIKKDPFNNKKIEYSKEFDLFYSIGPDCVDQFMKIEYDPTNGVFSVGDIKIR